ncbi:MAG: energy transducer TonB family protein [Marinobacter sp.]|uniref:energy transducer TonB family protein n=1 Tax=Marinobacter sp. TaxID=50741 RepID=UPI003F9C3F0E
MLEHGSHNSLPAKYRIALTLSTAFLIHTLLLSSVPAIVQNVPVQHRQQLNLELVGAKNSHSTPTAHAPVSGEKSPVRNPQFEITPDQSDSKPAEPVLSSRRSNQKTANSKEPQVSKTRQKKNQTEPVTPSRAASSPSKSGSRTQVSGEEVAEEVTRITQSPVEQDPYLVKLAMHLATQLETQRIPAIGALTDTKSMEIELQLMGNGALTRAKVITSTGNEQIDSAAHRAALSASPYPEPPPDQGGKNRFAVKLVFSPSRL